MSKKYVIVLSEAQARVLYRHAENRVALYDAPGERNREWRGILKACQSSSAPRNSKKPRQTLENE